MADKSVINFTSKVGASVIEDVRAHLVFLHQVFSVSKRFTVPKSASRYIIIDTTLCGCDFLVYAAPVFKAFGGGTVTIDLYQNPTYTPGTEWVALDRNFDTPVSPETKYYFNTSVAAEGTKTAWEWEIFSNGVAAVSSIGGESSEDIAIIAGKEQPYMFKLTNLDTTNDARCTFHSDFFEIDLSKSIT